MIRVLDALCGSGKSTAMFNAMKESPKERYLYITPFLSEIQERVPKELKGLKFKSPENNGKGKLLDIKRLIEKGHNIASTHALFGMFTPEIVDLVIEQEYILIIDEAVHCIGLMPTEFKPSDIAALLAGDFVIVDENRRGMLLWNEEKYPEHDGKYSEIRDMCNMEMLYSYQNTFLFWEYPAKLLRELEEVYVLTYLFGGSTMKGWLEINNIPFQIEDPEEWGLRSEEVLKTVFKFNIRFGKNRSLKNARQHDTTLSKSWFKNSNSDTINKYRAIIRSYVVINNIKSGDLFWTTFKEHAGKLSSAGYAGGVKHDVPNPCFLPCNIRATNDFRDRTHCIYAMNRYLNPIEVNYIKANGGSVDSDLYALGELIQFIYRGSIRKQKPMTLLILSKRMERLLQEWMDQL